MAFESKTASWLKILAVLATVIGGAIGSYKAARSDSKTEAAVSYAVMKEAIDHLEQNQKMIWDVIMKSQQQPMKWSLGLGDKSASSTASSSAMSGDKLLTLVPLRPLPRNFDTMIAQQPQALKAIP
jgi:hypothetical protein